MGAVVSIDFAYGGGFATRHPGSESNTTPGDYFGRHSLTADLHGILGPIATYPCGVITMRFDHRPA
jgi:hypothetical protein